MNKREALAKLPANLKSGAVHFSNINKSKPVWWLDIPTAEVTKAKHQSVAFVLYDDRGGTLHVLAIPTSFLSSNIDRLYRRPDKDMFSFELSAEAANRFENIKLVSSGLKLGQFLKHSQKV